MSLIHGVLQEKGIQPVEKLSDDALTLEQSENDLHMNNWCHCHPVISCFVKIRNVFLVPAYTHVILK